MGQWHVDYETKPGVLMMRLEGTFNVSEMREFVFAHNAGVDAFGSQAYRAFVDIRALQPLSPDCAVELERAKLYSAAKPNFQGSAVLATSAVVAMQHRRTSASGGVLDSELISDSEAACWEHLARVKRTAPSAG